LPLLYPPPPHSRPVPSHRISASTRVTWAESSSPASSHSDPPRPRHTLAHALSCSPSRRIRHCCSTVQPYAHIHRVLCAPTSTLTTNTASAMAYTFRWYVAVPLHHACFNPGESSVRPARHDRGYTLPCYARLPLVVPQISSSADRCFFSFPLGSILLKKSTLLAHSTTGPSLSNSTRTAPPSQRPSTSPTSRARFSTRCAPKTHCCRLQSQLAFPLNRPPSADMPAQFVADGEWKHDPTGSIDTDHEGNVNNVIYPEDLQPTLSSAAMSSVTPEAT
jgi:hypothetical protein